MGTERQVMQEYLDALVKHADFPSYFTEDVVATFEGTDQRADGRDFRRSRLRRPLAERRRPAGHRERIHVVFARARRVALCAGQLR